MAIWTKILVAVDKAESSMRALHYVGEITGCTAGLDICLLHIYPEPPPNYFHEGHTISEYKTEKEDTAKEIFAEALKILNKYNISHENITTLCRMAGGETISKSIQQVQEEGEYGTIVVGKRGVSKAEEFLFGSVSNTMARNCINYTVWVVG